jgi:hypothetical protein
VRGARVLTKGSVLPDIYDYRTLVLSSAMVHLFGTVASLRDWPHCAFGTTGIASSVSSFKMHLEVKKSIVIV